MIQGHHLDVSAVWRSLKEKEILTPDTYPAHVTRLLKDIHDLGYQDPLALTMQQARHAFRKRPLWSRSFAEKGFRSGSLLDSMQVVHLQRHTVLRWLAERELVTDLDGNPVLIERILTAGGVLTKLGIVAFHTGGNSQERAEVRLSRTRFAVLPWAEAMHSVRSIKALLSSTDMVCKTDIPKLF